jgi:hypothetical protein
MDLGESEWGGVNWIGLVQSRDKWRALVNAVMNFWGSINRWQQAFLYWPRYIFADIPGSWKPFTHTSTETCCPHNKNPYNAE